MELDPGPFEASLHVEIGDIAERSLENGTNADRPWRDGRGVCRDIPCDFICLEGT